nr:unnamed protein product [Digitaria exilis]
MDSGIIKSSAAGTTGWAACIGRAQMCRPGGRRVSRRPEEACHRHPRASSSSAGRHHPVLHALEPIVGHELQQVADVDDERSGHRRHVGPVAPHPTPGLTVEEHLEPTHPVLQEHRQEAGVRALLRARRVVVAAHHRPAVADVVPKAAVVREVPGVEAQGLRQEAQQAFAQPTNPPGVLRHGGAARRRDLLLRRLEEERVAPVGSRRLEGVVPDAPGRVTGEVGPPGLRGLLVEAPHRRQCLGEEVAGHAVVHHLEEADGLRGGPDLGDEPLLVVVLEVDDRDGGDCTSCYVVGIRRVVEDGWDGGDARVDEALDAGLGVVEGLELAEAVGGGHE